MTESNGSKEGVNSKEKCSSPGAGKMQSALNIVGGWVSLPRRVASFTSLKSLQYSMSGKGSSKLSSPVGESSRKLYTFCGFLALEVLVAVLLFCNREILTFHLCRHSGSPEPVYAPSAWYYEHVYKYPLPLLRILNTDDGASPIRSRVFPRDREITIATHTTADRLPAVKMTAMRWSGAMALAVLVRVRSEIPTVYKTLQEIHKEVEAEGRCRLNIQIIMEHGFKDDYQARKALYPINSMRNMALRMVTTQLILMIDADLVPSPGLHEHLTQDEDKYAAYIERATVKRHVLVVPSFQMIQDRSIPYRESIHALPHSDEELRVSLSNEILDCFQCDVSPDSQSPTDYRRFTDPAVDYPYDVTYKEGYEPYFVAAVEHFPKYDDRFRGYSKNKATHVYELSARGMGFTVIPEGFLVELPHLPSFSQRAYSGRQKDPMEKWRVDGLYKQFKADLNKELKVPEIPAKIYTAEE